MRPARDAGFTLVELLVVMVIVAILMGVVLSSSRGARDVSAETTVRGVARTYDAAIRSFQRAHGGRPPSEAAGEWAGRRGPREANSDVYYLRSVPEEAGGSIRVTAGSDIAVRAQGAEVRYVRPRGQRTWGVIAAWNGQVVCATGGLLPNRPRC